MVIHWVFFECFWVNFEFFECKGKLFGLKMVKLLVAFLRILFCTLGIGCGLKVLFQVMCVCVLGGCVLFVLGFCTSFYLPQGPKKG